MLRRLLLVLSPAVLLLGAAAATTAAPAAPKPRVTVYKSPTCGCCKAWVERMRAAGYDVASVDLSDMELDQYKATVGVTRDLASCHTALVGKYVVEGHVPPADVDRLLAEQPAVLGISAPGMPAGSPGMEMPNGRKDPYEVVSFAKGGVVKVYAKH